MKKLIAWTLALMMVLSLAACGSQSKPDAPAVSADFTVVVTDLDGNETTFQYTSDAKYVGEALLEEGLITGDMGEYGLYITSVNGITADWDADQTYWSFYIDGEYALTGVDTTEIVAGSTYSLVLTKG